MPVPEPVSSNRANMKQRQPNKSKPDWDRVPEPRPIPQSILDVNDPILRQRASDLFRNASRLFHLIDRQETWFHELKANGNADPTLAIRLGWEITACVRALVGLGVFNGPADQILALFPEPPSGVLAQRGFTEGEVQEIEQDLEIRVSAYYRKDRPNWFEDQDYIRRGVVKLAALSEFQGSLDLICRQLEAAPSLASDPEALGLSLLVDEGPLSQLARRLLATEETGELDGTGQSGRGHVIKPKWDPKKLTLSVGARICHRFKRKTNNHQLRIVEALEAAGWPDKSIPNPLRDEIQLRQTIKDFNEACVEGSPFRLTQDHNQVGWTLD
jgi:hypothetical protein